MYEYIKVVALGAYFFSDILVSSRTYDIMNDSLLKVAPFQFFSIGVPSPRNLILGPEFPSPASRSLTCAWVMAGGAQVLENLRTLLPQH